RVGDAGVHEDGVGAELHGDGGVGCGGHASIDDEGNGCDHFAQDADVSLVLNAHAAADGRAQRHDCGGTGVDQALGEDDVVGGVGQNGEAFVDQSARGFERGLHVGIKSGLVADDFELHPFGEADFAAQAGGADSLVGGVATGGVREQEIFLGIDVVEQGFL